MFIGLVGVVGVADILFYFVMFCYINCSSKIEVKILGSSNETFFFTEEKILLFLFLIYFCSLFRCKNRLCSVAVE